MSEDKVDYTIISRRTLFGAASLTPLACSGLAAANAPVSESLVSLCAEWLVAEFEADELARRWAALEIQAIAAYDYFGMSDRQRRRGSRL